MGGAVHNTWKAVSILTTYENGHLQPVSINHVYTEQLALN